MNILIGIEKFLSLVNDNWTLIVVIIGLAIGAYTKIQNYIELSNEEKYEIAKKQISQAVLKLVSDAEEDYNEWSKAGSIKRSQVIQQIFDAYPILSKIVEQNTVIEWIDDEIDNALVELRKVIEDNNKDKDIK